MRALGRERRDGGNERLKPRAKFRLGGGREAEAGVALKALAERVAGAEEDAVVDAALKHVLQGDRAGVRLQNS